MFSNSKTQIYVTHLDPRKFIAQQVHRMATSLLVSTLSLSPLHAQPFAHSTIPRLGFSTLSPLSINSSNPHFASHFLPKKTKGLSDIPLSSLILKFENPHEGIPEPNSKHNPSIPISLSLSPSTSKPLLEVWVCSRKIYPPLYFAYF